MKKKFLIIVTIIFICTACNSTNNEKSIKDVLSKYKYNTECSFSAINLDNDIEKLNEHNMESYYSSIDIAYNDLDDKISVVYLYNNFEFKSWKKAKEYFDSNINEWKKTNQEAKLSEENIDTDSRGEITVTKLYKEKNSPRIIIEDQKKSGYKCTTTSNSKD